jgi:hypothetical protein
MLIVFVCVCLLAFTLTVSFAGLQLDRAIMMPNNFSKNIEAQRGLQYTTQTQDTRERERKVLIVRFSSSSSLL